MTTLTADKVKGAICTWPCRYQTYEGHVFIGEAVSRVPTALRNNGWRNVSRLDAHDLRQLGLEVVKAQYVGGARPTGKFVDVVVAREVQS